jgi:hypothetical protein
VTGFVQYLKSIPEVEASSRTNTLGDGSIPCIHFWTNYGDVGCAGRGESCPDSHHFAVPIAWYIDCIASAEVPHKDPLRASKPIIPLPPCTAYSRHGHCDFPKCTAENVHTLSIHRYMALCSVKSMEEGVKAQWSDSLTAVGLLPVRESEHTGMDVDLIGDV